MVMFFGSLALSAQDKDQVKRGDRERFMTEMRNFKHDFLAKELDLSKDEQREFFPIYDRMEDEIGKLNDETRQLERKIEKDKNASDLELETATKAIVDQKGKEALIEGEYYEKFKSILSPRQLFNLKNAERKFNQELMRHHRRLARKANAAKR